MWGYERKDAERWGRNLYGISQVTLVLVGVITVAYYLYQPFSRGISDTDIELFSNLSYQLIPVVVLLACVIAAAILHYFISRTRVYSTFCPKQQETFSDHVDA